MPLRYETMMPTDSIADCLAIAQRNADRARLEYDLNDVDPVRAPDGYAAVRRARRDALLYWLGRVDELTAYVAQAEEN